VKLYLDANVIIYGYEADPPLKHLVLTRLAEWCRSVDGELATSVFSRLECRVMPLRNGNGGLLAKYDDFFSGDAVEVVEITLPIIDLATTLRARHGFKSPDAIHLATALHIGASRFLTADAALKRCSGIDVEVISVAPNYDLAPGPN
jgi:uncharacterized protein